MELTSILQSVLDVLFDRASTSLGSRIGVLFGAKEEINKMSKALLRINALVKDIEHRGVKDQRVKVWLDEIKGVAYDVEDMLEEFQYEDLKSQLEGTPRILNQVSSAFSLDDISRKSEIVNKIGNMRVRIDDIALQGNWFSLGEFGGVWQQQDEMSELRETNPLVLDRFKLFGRDDDVEAVIKLLMTTDGENVAMVPIVGMGGIGKTTLAQHVYNNEDVNSHFEVKIWVSVSINFDLKNLTREILQCIGEDSSSIFMSLDFLQIRLMEKLKHKKFLIVLDDVWLDSRNEWEHFRAPFTVGAQGSKLLVTTRSERVSRMMSLTDPYILKCLSEDDVWSLFAERAFGNMNPDEHPIELVGIGKKFIAKCMGLPLAARSLEDILHFKQEYDKWIEVQENEIFAQARNDILQTLQLSYYHLPSNLKKCFEYCSLFPKGYKFDKDDLVLQWMSANLIEATGPKPMEDMGRAFFEDLRLRSFFYANGSSTYKMHEFIHDLSCKISAGECVNMNEGGSLLSIPEKARHVSLVYMNPTARKVSNRCTSLRSLVFLPQPDEMPKIPIEQAALTDLFTKLPHLRMLDLNRSDIIDLPEAIGNLKYLRYLNLSHTKLKALPESVTSLYKLQTLKLIGTKVVELPKGITKLVNLRNLQLNNQIVSNCTPLGLGKLVNLQALESIVVDKGSGQGIRELKDMNCLSGALKIVKLENVVDAEEANLGELINKKRLTKLSLEWKEDNSLPDEVVSKVLECLRPHTNLQVLHIMGYNGVRFPSWMHNSDSNLVKVTLNSCKCCDCLPSLGQLPFLKILTITGMDGLKKVGREFCGNGKRSFPALKELYIREMLSLEVWYDVVEGDYPKLSILSIWDCPKLRSLPQFLPTLVHLSLSACDGLALQSLHFYSASLQHLEFKNFQEMKSLPNDLFQPLTSLKILTIVCFKQITSLAENGLENLSSLHNLNIARCENLTSFPERLRDLYSLQSLEIHDCESLLSFPDECLPTSLTELTLFNCQNLNCLPKGLQNLTFLKTLSMIKCPQLKFLPEDEMPTTLQELNIKDCPKLEECYHQGGYQHKIAPNTRVFLN